MALMQKPSDLDPEDTTEAQAMVALAEEGDVEEENLQYSGVAGFVEDQFRKSKDARQTEEERWLTAYRNYRGVYGPELQFTDTGEVQSIHQDHQDKGFSCFCANR